MSTTNSGPDAGAGSVTTGLRADALPTPTSATPFPGGEDHAGHSVLSADRRPRTLLLAGMVAMLLGAGGVCVYLVRGWQSMTGAPAVPVSWMWTPLAAILLGQTTLYLCERPVRADRQGQRELDAQHVAVLMPVFNEDPGYLVSALTSLLAQIRRPDSVHIVDDGSGLDYRDVRRWWLKRAAAAGIRTSWQRTANGGKRHAQVLAARDCPEAEILITVDSDAHLAPDALHEVLQPLADPRVQAVAGVVVAHNNRGSLISRLTDLWYVTGQLVDRSSLSPLGGVVVASGSLAAYRATVLTAHIDGYLSETFRGRPVTFSDDSMLTLYALLAGRVVQQPTAVVFSAMPETVGHHLRQYLRWMRGSTIRSLWRVRYLPVRHPAFLVQLLRWFQHLASTAAMVWVLAVHTRTGLALLPLGLCVPLLITSAQTLRYLSVRRSDQTLRSQLATWALTPLAVLWSWAVLRPVRWYATATCTRTGWGTRTGGAEVALLPPPAQASA